MIQLSPKVVANSDQKQPSLTLSCSGLNEITLTLISTVSCFINT